MLHLFVVNSLINKPGTIVCITGIVESSIAEIV